MQKKYTKLKAAKSSPFLGAIFSCSSLGSLGSIVPATFSPFDTLLTAELTVWVGGFLRAGVAHLFWAGEETAVFLFSCHPRHSLRIPRRKINTHLKKIISTKPCRSLAASQATLRFYCLVRSYIVKWAYFLQDCSKIIIFYAFVCNLSSPPERDAHGRRLQGDGGAIPGKREGK